MTDIQGSVEEEVLLLRAKRIGSNRSNIISAIEDIDAIVETETRQFNKMLAVRAARRAKLVEAADDEAVLADDQHVKDLFDGRR